MRTKAPNHYGILSFLIVNAYLLGGLVLGLVFRFNRVLKTIEWIMTVHRLYGTNPFMLMMDEFIKPFINIMYLLLQPFLIFSAIYYNKRGESLKVLNYTFIGIHTLLYIALISCLIYALNQPGE